MKRNGIYANPIFRDMKGLRHYVVALGCSDRLMSVVLSGKPNPWSFWTTLQASKMVAEKFNWDD